MSLIKTKLSASREELTTETVVIERLRQTSRKYQKQHRAKNIDAFTTANALVDTFTPSQLSEYLKDNKDDLYNLRVGVHSMKVNSYERALIIKAVKINKARGARDLFIRHCLDIVERE